MSLITPLLAVLILSGSWAAWRKSPLYSVKITLKLVSITLAIIALFLGAAQLNLSTNALTAVLLVMVFVVGIGGTALIIRVTDGHVAQLPPSARLITTHRHKIQRWIWRLLIVLSVCVGAALVLPGDGYWLPLASGGFLLIGSGPSLMALYMRARRLDLGMSQMTANPWIHWQYTPQQWQAWALNQLEWERAQANPPFSLYRNKRRYLSTAALLGLAFLVVCWLELDSKPWLRVLAAAAYTVGMLLFLASIQWFSRRNCDQRYRRLLKAPPETYFGDEGLFCNGEYDQWTFSGSFLEKADYLQDPPARLHMIFQTFNGSAMRTVTRRILIPDGRQPDLEMLQEKLRAACSTAIVGFSNQPVP